MKSVFQILGVMLLSIFSASAAQATFYCEMLSTTEMHERPDTDSPVVQMVPKGDFVSDMSGDEGVQGEWAKVAYSIDPKAYWGEGGIGWVKSDQLGECG